MGALEWGSHCDLRAGAGGVCAIRWLGRVVVTSIVVLGFPMVGATAQLPRSVLILDQSDTDSAWYQAFSSAFRATLNAKSAVRISVYTEHLDLSRFGGPRHDELMRRYLRDKFSERPIEVVVAQGSSALEFVLNSRAELWSQAPVVFASVDDATVTRLRLPPDVTGTTYQLMFRDAVTSAKTLVPGLKRIALVGDPFDRQAVRSHFKQEVALFAAEFELIDLMGLSMAELRRRVATLPRDTAIIYTAINIDGAGVAYRPYEALAVFAEVANRPIVIDTETSIGYGGVGGLIVSAAPVAEEAAKRVLRILDGEEASRIPITKGSFARPIFDWRQLRRFAIDERSLPIGSDIRFRSPSVWEQYRWYIIAAFTIISLQAAMISGLLLHRARRRRAEADLRESHQFMELATKAGKMGLWMRDLQKDEIWVNAHLRSLFGFSQTDVIRYDDVLARIHPYDRGQLALDVSNAEKAGIPFEGEFRAVLPDGSERWAVTRGETVSEPGGAVRRLGTVIDITERKRAEESLRESEDRFRTMANTAPVMIWMSGTDKLCTFFNKGWLDYTGRPLEQELGNGWAEDVHREDFARCLEIYAHAFNTQQEFTMEYRLRRFDGEYCWVLDHGVPRFEPDGKFLGYIGCAIDIGERKRGELEAVQQRAELAHIARVSTMGELAASLAHELNQPLTAILSNAQAAQRFLASKSPDLEEVHEILQDIVQDNMRAGEVIWRMRTLVKKEESDFAPLNLASVIGDVVVLIHSEAVLHSLRVEADIALELPLARGDKIQLQQVVLNLLLNAFDAMRDCPTNERTIVIRAAPNGNSTVEVAVRDRGTGLTTDKLDEIFQPFYTTKREGLGMGLSISRSIVEAHGGRLWAENNADRGATFYFTIPVSAEENEVRVK